jgi:hypothetical protein
MKELIEKLLSGEGKLSLLLLRAKELAEKSDDTDLISFIDKELNGYEGSDLPEYRLIKAVITGTIKNSYGEIVKKGEAINFSVLSKHLGFDVAVAHIPDGIGFVEDGLAELKDQLVERPLHNEIVKMLNNVFKHNNPNFNLTAAEHQFPRAAIRHILTKVREELINGLRRVYKEPKSEFNKIVDVDVPDSQNSVFVTYAWEDEEHNEKVISFVDFLRKKGYMATMDKKESQEKTATNFNQMMIDGIQKSEKVIVVLSPKYKEKAEKFSGGVGFEYGIILDQLKTNSTKFIFVSFGNNKNEEIVPIGIGGRDILNLKKDQDEDFNQLSAKLQSKNIIEFSDVNPEIVEVKLKEIKPFKL